MKRISRSIREIKLPGTNTSFIVPEMFKYVSQPYGSCSFRLEEIIPQENKIKLLYSTEFGSEDPESKILSSIESDLAKVGEYMGGIFLPRDGEKQGVTFTIILLPQEGGYMPYIADYCYPNFSVGVPSHYLTKYGSLDEAVSKAIEEVPVDFNATIM